MMKKITFLALVLGLVVLPFAAMAQTILTFPQGSRAYKAFPANQGVSAHDTIVGWSGDVEIICDSASHNDDPRVHIVLLGKNRETLAIIEQKSELPDYVLVTNPPIPNWYYIYAYGWEYAIRFETPGPKRPDVLNNITEALLGCLR